MISPARTRTQPTGGLGRHAGKASLPCAMASRMNPSRACRSCSLCACIDVNCFGSQYAWHATATEAPALLASDISPIRGRETRPARPACLQVPTSSHSLAADRPRKSILIPFLAASGACSSKELALSAAAQLELQRCYQPERQRVEQRPLPRRRQNDETGFLPGGSDRGCGPKPCSLECGSRRPQPTSTHAFPTPPPTTA